MLFSSLQNALDFFGRGEAFGLSTLSELMVYQTGAGTPADTASSPTFIGEEYFDTYNSVWYKAAAIGQSSAFKAMGNLAVASILSFDSTTITMDTNQHTFDEANS